MSFIENLLLQLNKEKRRWRRIAIILTVLSLIVALVTVWNLRMIGITIANDATCGYAEHPHTEKCWQDNTLICGYDEHIHLISCYSDQNADVETAKIWEATLPEIIGEKSSDVLSIAQSQLGYIESEKNYILTEDGQSKHGITRYGQWYGNPYGDWANIFTSFCLRYAGVSEELTNSSAD